MLRRSTGGVRARSRRPRRRVLSAQRTAPRKADCYCRRPTSRQRPSQAPDRRDPAHHVFACGPDNIRPFGFSRSWKKWCSDLSGHFLSGRVPSASPSRAYRPRGLADKSFRRRARETMVLTTLTGSVTSLLAFRPDCGTARMHAGRSSRRGCPPLHLPRVSMGPSLAGAASRSGRGCGETDPSGPRPPPSGRSRSARGRSPSHRSSTPSPAGSSATTALTSPGSARAWSWRRTAFTRRLAHESHVH